ncbi:hypothetical protein [Nocardia bovistercoris]|uniref:Uncharacterized protein n=1 Tax=Nocardia bovistercoris TaxID=2785916 RepID=A0A931I790_9NOCA|nr:hypothetical protein [Nocardia bovistercoris]MBH0775155.1 hypothetical protein [Nocardia bovistercoris]
MNTAIRENVRATVQSDSAELFDGAEQSDKAEAAACAPRRAGARALEVAPRRVARRRPRDGRPGAPTRLYRRGPVRSVVRAPRGEHPMRARVEQATVGFAVLAAAALLSALAVTALIVIAHWRAGTLPEETSTVPGVVERHDVPSDPLPR